MTEQPAKRLDDYIELGRYVVCICILAELMILPQVSSMVYMMYAGASPSLASCEDGLIFDSSLEEKEVCELYHQIPAENCSSPSLKYQFKSVNVEVALQIHRLNRTSVSLRQIWKSFAK
ncbi:hypothetical protein ANCCAN_22755 [Ancylostoma caninum]|uniref:Uncharacterized protein n=1 Tax=Ancylostoma caninum TaxID=29170 RepID=A0A368FKW1_ANCCA|nr:hypothetical protein ANCCAN_22755 [Ancylostoma caninum]